MLLLAKSHWQVMVAHCLDGLPLEACGLLAARPAAPLGEGGPREGEDSVVVVEAVYPTGNAARSARIYSVEPGDLLRADRAAEKDGLELIGVWHSHTHTPAYPSPTDIAQAPDPAWHYVLVSLSAADPVVRSYRIIEGSVGEEPITLT